MIFPSAPGAQNLRHPCSQYYLRIDGAGWILILREAIIY
jgi:hypothetical protein